MTRPVRIAIVGQGLRAGGGISVGINCVAALARLPLRKHIFAILPRNVGYETAIGPELAERVHWVESDIGKIRRMAFDLFRLTKLLKAFAPDVVLCLGNQGVAYARGRQIIVVQDAHYFYGATHYFRASPIKKLIYRLQRLKLAHDLKSNPLVFCQTPVAAQRLKDWYRFQGDVRILPNAVSTLILPATPNAYPLPGPAAGFRLVYVARYYPHKNLEILVDLFERYRAELGDCVVYITIAESHGAKARQLLQRIADSGLANCIVNLGPVPQERLASLYTSVDGLLMPTLLESYSGTYLEAMQFGCPILTSDRDFARYICGTAALYFDPLDVASIFQTIAMLKHSARQRFELVEAGRLQLSGLQTTWDINGSILASAIQELVERPQTAS